MFNLREISTWNVYIIQFNVCHLPAPATMTIYTIFFSTCLTFMIEMWAIRLNVIWLCCSRQNGQIHQDTSRQVLGVDSHVTSCLHSPTTEAFIQVLEHHHFNTWLLATRTTTSLGWITPTITSVLPKTPWQPWQSTTTHVST